METAGKTHSSRIAGGGRTDRALRLLADVVFYGACGLMIAGALLTVALS